MEWLRESGIHMVDTKEFVSSSSSRMVQDNDSLTRCPRLRNVACSTGKKRLKPHSHVCITFSSRPHPYADHYLSVVRLRRSADFFSDAPERAFQFKYAR